jgi:hypothetical protein
LDALTGAEVQRDIEIDSKPLQGLKPLTHSWRVVGASLIPIEIDLKPLQGLKQSFGDDDRVRSNDRNRPQTLTGR